MRDSWAFLLQTLTASGVAALLLIVKRMFQDKLSPRWQFAAWGILAMVLLVPAGLGGRYVLFNWPMLVEMAKSVQTGTFGTLTQVTAPVPLPADWSGDLFFAVYTAGVVWFLLRYAAAYIRLRRGLG